jgi:hypothetical protein
MSVLATFNDLIDQNSSYLMELDNYNLDSADPASAADLAALENAYRKEAKALIKFVVKWRLELLEALN